MKQQIDAIRAALEDLDDQYNSRKWDALTALTQLEAMAGEPVAWVHPTQGHMQRRTETMSPEVVSSYGRGGWTPLYAAPVAQQQERITPAELAKRIERGEKWEVAQQPQAEAVPPDVVLVPVAVLKAASESLGSFVSDNGWTDLDMQAMDNIDAILAQQKGGV